MKNRLLLILLIIVLGGCAGSPLQTSVEAERHLSNMTDVEIGMSQSDVRSIMGNPYKVEKRTMEGIVYEVWYYITRGALLSQTRLIDSNFTPLVFLSGYLRGWGWNYYNYLFDINNARFRREEEMRQRYTDDRNEWPPNEHKIISPYMDDDDEQKVEEAIKELQKDQVQEPSKKEPPGFTEIEVGEQPKAPPTTTPKKPPTVVPEKQVPPTPPQQKKTPTTLQKSHRQ